MDDLETRIKVLNLQDGDVLVIEVRGPVSTKQSEAIKRAVHEVLPLRRVLVMGHDARLTVLRPGKGDIEPRPQPKPLAY